MGTRSLTIFIDNFTGGEIVVMYQQYDGYPEGYGRELAEFLAGMVVVNGLGGSPGKVANGMSCLTAQVVANFKNAPGNTYLHVARTRDIGEEYIYILRESSVSRGTVEMECWTVPYDNRDNEQLFSGTPREFLEWVELEKEEIA